MPFHAHCPSCKEEYDLVDSLRGKYVVCERCRQSFRAETVRIPPNTQTFPPVESPAPPAALPRVIVPNVAMPSKRPAPPVKTGGSKSAVPVGVIVAVCLLLVRACTTMTKSHTNDPPRPKTPTAVPKALENFNFRMAKDKGLVVVPKNPDESKLPEGWMGKEKGKTGGAEPGKR